MQGQRKNNRQTGHQKPQNDEFYQRGFQVMPKSPTMIAKIIQKQNSLQETDLRELIFKEKENSNEEFEEFEERYKEGIKYYSLFPYESQRNHERKPPTLRHEFPLMIRGLDRILLRDKLFTMTTKESRRLPSAGGIRNKLNLFSFIHMLRPFKKVKKQVELKWFVTAEIFKYKDLAKHQIIDIQEVKHELTKCYLWCKNVLLIKSDSDDEDLLRNFEDLIESKAFNDDSQVKTEEILFKIESIRKQILKRIKTIIGGVNKKSFYYMQTRLENVYELVQSEKSQSKDNIQRIKRITKGLCKCMKRSAKEFTKLFMNEDYEDVKEEWKEALCLYSISELLSKEAHPSLIWGELLAGFQSLVERFKILLSSRISYKTSKEIEYFFEKLIDDPFSILRNRKTLNINWKVVEKLLNIYEKFDESQKKQLDEHLSKREAHEIPILTSDLLFVFSHKSPDTKQEILTSVTFPDSYQFMKDAFKANLIGLRLEDQTQDQEMDMLQKKLLEVIKASLSVISFLCFSNIYELAKQKGLTLKIEDIEDIKIIIYSNDSVRLNDLSGQEVEGIKTFLKKSFSYKNREPRMSEEKLLRNIKKKEESSKADLDQKLSYFNYEFLEGILTSSDIYFEDAYYFVAANRLQGKTELKETWEQCMVSREEIAQMFSCREGLFPFRIIEIE